MPHLIENIFQSELRRLTRENQGKPGKTSDVLGKKDFR
jgi:hypothetical protein